MGERHISEQERRVAELDRDGHDTRQALALLATFRELQLQHVAHRDMILSQLAAPPKIPSAPIFRPGHYDDAATSPAGERT